MSCMRTEWKGSWNDGPSIGQQILPPTTITSPPSRQVLAFVTINPSSQGLRPEALNPLFASCSARATRLLVHPGLVSTPSQRRINLAIIHFASLRKALSSVIIQIWTEKIGRILPLPPFCRPESFQESLFPPKTWPSTPPGVSSSTIGPFLSSPSPSSPLA
jgi:hypothetical protein